MSTASHRAIQSATGNPQSEIHPGFIGFTFEPGIVSAGVAFAERWNRRGDIKVSHTLVVSAPGECIEAHLDEGVARVSLEKYLGDQNCRIFFRQPRGKKSGSFGRRDI